MGVSQTALAVPRLDDLAHPAAEPVEEGDPVVGDVDAAGEGAHDRGVDGDAGVVELGAELGEIGVLVWEVGAGVGVEDGAVGDDGRLDVVGADGQG